MDVQTGTVKLWGGGLLGGGMTVAGGTQLEFRSGSFTNSGIDLTGALGGQLTFSGSFSGEPFNLPRPASAVAVNGGNVTLSGTVTNLSLSSGNLYGTILVPGTMNWTGGDLYGALTVATNGLLTATGGYLGLFGALTNAGTMRLVSGVLQLFGPCYGANGGLVNLPGALVDIQSDISIYHYCNDNPEVFVNQGVVQKSGGSGSTTIEPIFINSGILDVQTGIVRFTESYTETPSASLVVSIGGTSPGSGYDKIQFLSPSPSFAGSLTVLLKNGFMPSPGDSFAVLNYSSFIGDFSYMNGLNLGNGLQLVPHYGGNGLALVTVAVATNSQPTLSFYLTPHGTLISWPLDFKGWQLEMTTNLTTSAWAPVSLAGTNNIIVPRIGQGFFRLKHE